MLLLGSEVAKKSGAKGPNLSIRTLLDGCDYCFGEKVTGDLFGVNSQICHYSVSRQCLTTSRKMSDSVIMPTTSPELSKTGRPLILLANII